MTGKETSLTPLRKQYLRIKQKYPGAIVFFRLGDFYETFDEDARVASRELEIVLTAREMGKGVKVPLAGIPYHALENYLARLISRGYKVAICEQLTPPGRGLVERDVIRVVTAGTLIEPGLLAEKSNNYLVSLLINKGQAGIACADITTGEFAVTQVARDRAADEIARLNPAEIIVPGSSEYVEISAFRNITEVEAYFFEQETARQSLLELFSASSLEGYGCEHLPLAVGAAGAVVAYLRENQKTALGLLNRLSTYSTGSFMTLDMQTIRNLELYSSLRWGTAQGSLLSVIDITKTSMGGRLLKRYLGQPLLDLESLGQRQQAVEWFFKNTMIRGSVIALLADMPDMERIINRVRSGNAIPRELVALKAGLEKSAAILPVLADNKAPLLMINGLKPCPGVVELITAAIADEPAATFERLSLIHI